MASSRALSLFFCLCLGGCNRPDTGEPAGDTDGGTSVPTPISDLDGYQHEEIVSLFYATWHQDQPATVWVEYRLEDEDDDVEAWASTPSASLDTGAQEQLLLGLPYDSTFDYRVCGEIDGDSWQSEELSARTGALPEDLPKAEVLAADATAWDPQAPYLITSFAIFDDKSADYGSWTIILDRAGRTVWALASPEWRSTLYVRVSRDGSSFLIDHDSFWTEYDMGAESQIQRLRIDGTVSATYETPGLHHSFTDLPDGSLIWGSMESGDEETLEVLSPKGERSTLFSCHQFLVDMNFEGTCGTNTIEWDEPSDTLLASFYEMDSVLELDRTTGEPKAWYGTWEGSYEFEPQESQFKWQHGVSYTEEGTLLLSTRRGNMVETVVREYEVQAESEVLKEIWSFGEDEGIYANSLGGALRLANGNTQHNYGSGGRLREVTPEGVVVWDIGYSQSVFLGRSVPLQDLYAFLEQ